MLPPFTPRLAALVLLLPVAGCASGPGGGIRQPIALSTTPPGATCEVRQAGAVAVPATSTPRRIDVRKSPDPLLVVCTAPGYLESRRRLVATESAGMAAAYFLAGGMIGLATGAASGALSSYPDTIEVVLQPGGFTAAVDRDRFFDAREADLEAVRRIELGNRAACMEGDQSCLNRQAAEDAGHEAELARLRAARSSAVVGG